MRIVLGLLCVLLALAALALAALSLGALASLNAGSASPLLSAVSAAETVLSGRVHLMLEAFWRALVWAGLCCACVWFAAYLKPR
ncbi:hypothetical protein MF271_10400 [Deinococcus sp. KNUC1210]|uniref:hypothetical protein n=1 Tax=Deinococcus sp. KNUC1210 TaxID=2917691 RepID=UPI001EF04FDA|nr:hypothetical protein [Deinococcus sp. KNUC1210]ULH14446.1 hypothetical protein MF271_10400 [Deinococcus sp. KNUC1210]